MVVLPFLVIRKCIKRGYITRYYFLALDPALFTPLSWNSEWTHQQWRLLGMDTFRVSRKNFESFGLSSEWADSLDVQSQTRSLLRVTRNTFKRSTPKPQINWIALVDHRPNFSEDLWSFSCVHNMIQISHKMKSLLPLTNPDTHKNFQEDPLITFGVMSNGKLK